MDIVFKNYRYKIIEPSICPHCHNGIEPRYRSNISDKGPGTTDVDYTIWQCTRRDCNKLFVAVNVLQDQGKYYFRGYLDGSIIIPPWPETINKIPSNFIETYKQSLEAEQAGLNEIAGMGFRKSIEYLVKDYLIYKAPELKGNIEDTLLAKVIGENFKDSREVDLKDLLQRATWLGNDMTHYLRYHENFDINDLKELIKLVVGEIHSIEQKRHYINSIQSKYSK